MEALLQQMSGAKSMARLGGSVTPEVADGSMSASGSSPDADSSKDTLPSSDASPGPSTSRSAPFMPRVEDQSADPSDEEAEFRLSQLKHSFKHMSLSDRFFGKSSGARLIKSAMDLKMEYASEEQKAQWQWPRRRREFWIAQPVRLLHSAYNIVFITDH